MAGRILQEDIEAVRERARIDEVVEQYVALRNAGGGARKGLCPFHDEKSPSFNVRPSVGTYHCFGCGVGGDVYRFLMEIEGMTFVEAVERLAGKYGIVLRYEEGSTPGPRRDPNQRNRLLEAHKLAGEFYADFLGRSPDAQAGRQFVQDRGFSQEAAEHFGMGFAPRSGDALSAHLTSKGFSADELVTGGLVGRNDRGLYDRFRGRLLWPIREMTGEIVGFGARRIFEDDRIEAKYLNTSESPIYKKSQVLYGIDLARRAISGESRAVIVEGYTDVMACHEAGVTTAVATCGTAFGEGHARVLRRLMLDHDAFRGEVVFTFDGDEAGQRAALKTFQGDQQFVSQTYVAVEPRGMDPCDLRLADGDEAVRNLVDSRIPLYRFVLDNMLSRYDLDRGDQRIDAMREAVTLASSIRDKSKVDELLREIAGRIGVDVAQVRAAHKKSANRRPREAAEVSKETPVSAPPIEVTSFGGPKFADEREALKALTQYPHIARHHINDLSADDFTHPIAQHLFTHLQAQGWPDKEDAGWFPRVSGAVEGETTRKILEVAAVEPMLAREANVATVVASVLARLQLLSLQRQIDDVNSRLQRTDPGDAEQYREVFSQLIALEQRHRNTRDRILGVPSP